MIEKNNLISRFDQLFQFKIAKTLSSCKKMKYLKKTKNWKISIIYKNFSVNSIELNKKQWK